MVVRNTGLHRDSIMHSQHIKLHFFAVRIDASEIAILRSERRNQLNGSQFPSQWVSIRLDPDKCGPKLYGHGSQGGGFGSPETVKLRQSDRI